MFFLINYLFFIKWIDLITSPILYKCIMTFYLFILASIIYIIIPIILPFDIIKNKKDDYILEMYYLNQLSFP